MRCERGVENPAALIFASICFSALIPAFARWFFSRRFLLLSSSAVSATGVTAWCCKIGRNNISRNGDNFWDNAVSTTELLLFCGLRGLDWTDVSTGVKLVAPVAHMQIFKKISHLNFTQFLISYFNVNFNVIVDSILIGNFYRIT